MKKFLFTLAALFMVGTVCAEEYWYIEDFEVTQAQLGKTITVPVKAHFDYAVSAAQIDFTIPDGMTLTRISKGSDFTINVHDKWGDEWPAENTVFVAQAETKNVGWAFADEDYYQDASGNWVLYGSPKFLPGEYVNQMTLSLRVDASFKGGEIIVESQPSCTYDLRPGVEVCPEGQDNFKTCNVTVEGATPTLQDCSAPVIDWSVNPGAVVVTVTPDEATDGELVYDGEYSYERKAKEYTVHVTAYTKATDTFNQSPVAEKDIVVPALETARTPEITYSYENGKITVWAYGSQDGNTYTLIDPDGVEHENNYTFAYNIYEGYDKVWQAYAAGTYYQQSATAEKQVIVEAQKYQTPAPTVTINDDANPTTITVTGEGNLTLYVGGEAVATGTETLTYTIAWPAYGAQEQYLSVYATALNTQYEDAMPGTSQSQLAFVGVQEAQWQDVAAPTFTITSDDDNVYVTVNWPTTTGEKVYTGEYIYARGEKDASYDVEAYTKADYPYNESAHATTTVNVPKKEEVVPVETKTFVKVTAADQLVAGKKYIIVAGNKAMGVEATGKFLTAIDITAGNEVEVGDNVAIMTLAGTTGHFTLALGEQYLHAVNSTNLNFDTATEWAITNYNGTLDGYRVKHADCDRAVRYSAGYDRFGNYSTTDDNSVYGWIYVEKTETPALQDLTGTIVASDITEDGQVSFSYTGNEDVTITVNGAEYTAGDMLQLEEGENEFTVVVSATGYNDMTEDFSFTWTAPVVPTKYTITVAENIVNGTVACALTEAEAGTTVNFTVTPAEGYVIDQVTVTTEAGEAVELNRADYAFTMPAANVIINATFKQQVVPAQVGAPKIVGYTEDGITGYGVTITPTTEGSEIKYCVYVWQSANDPENPEAGEWVLLRDWTEYEGTEKEIWYTEENNKYRVEAYAYIGQNQSQPVSYEFVVQHAEPTSINEMNAGKTIAGVRYFNLAGQEMQEANGMTIVVTTYTDGTTSAVKVMK